MSNRFLSLGVTSELAREDTLVEIRDTINNGIELNANNITELNGNTIDLGIGNTSTGTQRIVLASDQPAIDVNFTGSGDVNITEVKGTAISVDHGSADAGTIRVTLPNDVLTTGWEDVPTNLNSVNSISVPVSNGVATGGTQRVVLANNQDTTNWGNVPINIIQLNGNSISTANGISDSGTQRVTLVSDQDTSSWNAVPTNLQQINGTTVSQASGGTNLGTQRVTISNNQDTSFWDNIRVQNINNRNNLSSVEFNRFINNFTGNATRFIHPNGVDFITDITNPTVTTSIFMPASNTTAYIKSTSANDTSAGTGLQTVQVQYYSSNGTLQTRTVNLSGTTGSDITLGNADFFRIKDILPLVMGTVNTFNNGEVFINDNATPATGNDYPGIMEQDKNKWLSSWIHLPVLTTGYSGTTHLDTATYNWWQNLVVSYAEFNINIYTRNTFGGSVSPWIQQGKFTFEGGHDLHEVSLKNILFPSALGWVDLVYTIQTSANPGTYISVKLDYHTE